MSKQLDERASHEYSAHCARARAYLKRAMEERGLLGTDGWRIVETVRSIIDGTEIVMRPLHLYHSSPDDLECTVRVMEHSGVESRCLGRELGIGE